MRPDVSVTGRNSAQGPSTHAEAQTPEPRSARSCLSRFVFCGRGATTASAEKGAAVGEIDPGGSDAFVAAMEMSVQVSASSAAAKVDPKGVAEETKTALEAAAASDGAKIKRRLVKRPPPSKAGASKKRPPPRSDRPLVAPEPSGAGAPGTPKTGPTLTQGDCRGREGTGEVRASR